LGFDLRAKAENQEVTKDDEGNPVYPGREQEIEEGVHKLETLLEANIDRNFDKFEIWVLRNVLCVPEDLVPWVQLGHYRVRILSACALLTTYRTRDWRSIKQETLLTALLSRTSIFQTQTLPTLLHI